MRGQSKIMDRNTLFQDADCKSISIPKFTFRLMAFLSLDFTYNNNNKNFWKKLCHENNGIIRYM